MTGRLIAAAAFTALMLSTPAVQAATPQQKGASSLEKMETCNFGADELKLIGEKRKAYLAKCTSGKDSPRGKAIGAPAGAPKPQQ